MVSCWSLAVSFLCLERSWFTCGWMACIAFIDFMLFTVSGKKIAFMMTVSRMMATP